ncbi:UDP-glucose 4-epimerase [Cylindrobasidium torrendii FP15055 ss-10]|uniref:UDP-glucose 4-epimerase n=1 Tax=Cylindrobasidium torrendii FP15055 ss-10 TaxID=1314674 RepID=A0A0D7BFU3_9AGAR|nr:UDP-glucose 4-epimerase [Cylindrobasidium torrendii FP15055 ss-10]
MATASKLRTVIVTGGAGYIGSHVVYCLVKTRQYKVISIDNGHNSFPEALARVSQLAREEQASETKPADLSEEDWLETNNIVIKDGDITEKEVVRALFEEQGGKGKVWGVIHIAAWKAVGESTEIPLTYYHNNASATIQLLQTMNEYDCKRFVYSSSATVYGIPPKVPIPETSPLGALSPYGKTKVMCEMIVEDLCTAQPEWKALSLRYFNPAGAHPSGRFGEDPKGTPLNLLPILGQMAVGRLPPTLNVMGNDYPTADGTCVRDYLHVMDLASGHVLALNKLVEDHSDIFPDKKKQYKQYNLGTGKGESVLEIVEAMRKATGFDYKLEIGPRRAGDVPALIADPALAQKELGFHTTKNLVEMCHDLWNWQSQNPNGFEGSA